MCVLDKLIRSDESTKAEIMDRAGGDLERRLNLGVMDPGDLSQSEEQALISVTK